MSDENEENLKFIIPYYDDYIDNNYSSNKGYKCELCQKMFHVENDYKVHMKIHSGEKPYICNFPNCFRKFNRKANLELHEKICHSNNPKFSKSVKNYAENILKDNFNENIKKLSEKKKYNKGDYKLKVYSTNPLNCYVIKSFNDNNDKKEKEEKEEENENENNNNDDNNKYYLYAIIKNPLPNKK